MHSLWLAFFLLLATASGGDASPSHVSVRSFLLELKYLMQRAANTCTQAGQTICNANCSAVLQCVADGHGGFEELQLQVCASGSRCSAERGVCVAGATACGATSQGYIDCHATGYFPDPYDCTLYHLCIAEYTQSIPQQCNPGYAYNPLTTDCSYLTTDPICTEGPVPTCVSMGQSGPLPTNPSIYYFCTAGADNILRPQLSKCTNGEIYDPQLGCVNTTTSAPTPTTTTSAPTPTTTTSAPTPTTTTTAPTPSTTTDAPFPVPGEPCWPPLTKVADPLDCTAYYECSDHFVWLHVGCTFGFYFNPVHGRCELGWC